MVNICKRGLMVAALLSLSHIACAAGVVAHVVWVKGEFSASGRDLSKGSPIYLHDVLSTGPNSQAGIAFTDSTLMTFKQNSEYSVDRYQLKTAVTNGSFRGTLTTGGFRTITGAIAKETPGNYSINTPVATIGVRGTDYQAVLKGRYLYVVVYEGTVCMTDHSRHPVYSPPPSTPIEPFTPGCPSYPYRVKSIH